MAAKSKYVISSAITLEAQDLWELVFDEKRGEWCVDHYWHYQETRSRGTHRWPVTEFEATTVGKRLADDLQEAMKRARLDAQGT